MIDEGRLLGRLQHLRLRPPGLFWRVAMMQTAGGRTSCLRKPAGMSATWDRMAGRFRLPLPAFPDDTDLLIVMLGTNDLLQGRSPEQAAERLERFLTAVPVRTKQDPDDCPRRR